MAKTSPVEFENISYEVRADGVGVVTMQRPEYLNAWSDGILADVTRAFELMQLDDAVRAVLITGTGRGFCAGAYIKNPDKHTNITSPGRILKPLANEEMLLQTMWEFTKPIVAAVNGLAYGGGFNMVLCADLVVSSEDAQYCFPMAKLGIMPAFPGVGVLALRVGVGKAAEMCMFADPVDGVTAAQIGLANVTVPADQLLSVGLEWAAKLAANAPMTVRLVKADLRDSIDDHINRRGTKMRALLTFLSEDSQEGHLAWREGRRKPNFQGK